MVKEAAAEGWSTAKKYVKWGSIIWAVGLLLIGLTFVWPAWDRALTQLGEFKERTGVKFGIVSTMLLGGVVPTIIHFLTTERGERMSILQALGKIGYWAISGTLGYYFIKLQTFLWGEKKDVLTITQKVITDQFPYAMLVNTHLVLIIYLFIDNHYSVWKTHAALKRKSYLHRFIKLLIASYAVWIPAKVIIYAVPSDLTFPFQAMMIGLWGVILNLIGD